MDSFIIIILIVILTVVLICSILLLIVYSGLFKEVKVGAGTPPIQSAVVWYKFGRGSYKDTGPIFTEVTSIAPNHKSFGIYYDDPDRVQTSDLRWAVGVIAAEGSVVPDETLVAQFEKEEYRQFTFPAIQNAVKATFPCPTQISVLLGIYMVYPKLGEYVKERRLCAHPWIEIYDGENIHYMAPLSKQDQFYVPETQKTNKEQGKYLVMQQNDSKMQEGQLDNKKIKEPSTVRPRESSNYSGSDIGAMDNISSVTGALPPDIKHSHGLAGKPDNIQFRSKSVNIVQSNKNPDEEPRSSSVDTAAHREKALNSTPLTPSPLEASSEQSQLEGIDSLDFDASICSSSSYAESDVSTASSFYSSEYSCSSSYTVQNSSLNNDISKSEIENAEQSKLCKES